MKNFRACKAGVKRKTLTTALNTGFLSKILQSKVFFNTSPCQLYTFTFKIIRVPENQGIIKVGNEF